MTGWLLAVAVLLLAANAFFVAVEFALVASRRTRLEPMAASGGRRARVALAAMLDLNFQLAGSQLGITMASLGLGFVAEPAVARVIETALEGVVDLPPGVLHTVSFIVALTIVVFLHMVLGEMVPKNIALAGPERVLLALALPNRVYMWVLAPVIWVLNSVASAGIRLFGVEPKDEIASAHTADEFASMLAESREEGLLEDFEHALLRGALEFDERPVSEVMVPRDDVVVVLESATVRAVERLVVDRGHSRLVVVSSDLDDAVGFVHAKDLLTLSARAQDAPLPARLIRGLVVQPETRTLGEVLLAMRTARIHLALVVGADGGARGLVTLEDLLEELVGEIMDESDRT